MKIGLALSGGGVKGAAHIGAIKAMQENGIFMDAIGGTSSGSMVACLYALEYNPEQMLTLFNYFAKGILKASPRYVTPEGKKSLSINVGGFLSGESIAAAVRETARLKNVKYMKDLFMPIAIPAVDIDNGKKYVFTNNTKQEEYYLKDAEVAIAARASSSYPGIFAPCLYQGHKFIDGGVLDNVPVEEVKKLGVDKVMAIKFNISKEQKPKGVYEVAMKAVDMMFDNVARLAVQSSDYILDIDLGGCNAFNIKNIDKCYEAGYQEAMTHMEEIKEKLEI